MENLPRPAHPSRAAVRTRVQIPVRFSDGFSTTAEAVTFTGLRDGLEHLALVFGAPAPTRGTRAGSTTLVRMHSECLTGDVFGSARCDCGPQLREAVGELAATGGVLLYLRQEGRGIGLYNKLDAYSLQDAGLDTYTANSALGLPEDGRDYSAGAQMLAALGVGPIELLTNNPEKVRQLRAAGVDVVVQRRTGVFVSDDNARYLQAKVEHTGHTMSLDPSTRTDTLTDTFTHPGAGTGTYPGTETGGAGFGPFGLASVAS